MRHSRAPGIDKGALRDESKWGIGVGVKGVAGRDAIVAQ